MSAKNTSRTCSKCNYSNQANRPSQAVFHCRECGFTTNADVNAADNIRRQGLAWPGQKTALTSCLGVPPDALKGNKRKRQAGSTSFRSLTNAARMNSDTH